MVVDKKAVENGWKCFKNTLECEWKENFFKSQLFFISTTWFFMTFP